MPFFDWILLLFKYSSCSYFQTRYGEHSVDVIFGGLLVQLALPQREVCQVFFSLHRVFPSPNESLFALDLHRRAAREPVVLRQPVRVLPDFASLPVDFRAIKLQVPKHNHQELSSLLLQIRLLPGAANQVEIHLKQLQHGGVIKYYHLKLPFQPLQLSRLQVQGLRSVLHQLNPQTGYLRCRYHLDEQETHSRNLQEYFPVGLESP